MKGLKRRVRPANVIAVVALFLALGGVAFAAVKLGKGAVKTRNIANNAVTAKKIKNNAVTTKKIKNNAVTSTKIADNAVTSTKIADNAVTTGKIADNAVTTGKIADSAVTTGKIADSAVTSAKVADGSIGESDLTSISFTAATLQNGWTAVGTSPSPSFGKDALGFVHLRGRTRNPGGTGANGTVAFTLPAGDRPQETELFTGPEIFGGYSAVCDVTIDPSGTVTAGITGENNLNGCQPAGSISFSGMSFKAG
jgi:hypothetical protein